MKYNSGVYKITNTENGKIYIGSSKNISERFGGHKFDLRNNTHNNSYLQHAWSKYGSDNFYFEVILYCNKDNLELYEQKAINSYSCMYYEEGYNIREEVDLSELTELHKVKIGRANRDKKTSISTKRLMSENCRSDSYIQDKYIKKQGKSKKLNIEIVLEIKMLIFNSDKSYQEIANKYGLDKNTVSQIALGKTWRYTPILPKQLPRGI